MKKLMVVLMAMAFLMVSATVVLAGDTEDVVVTASITGTCLINSADDIDFGTLDQTSGSDETATGNIEFWCTKGTAYTLTDDSSGALSGPEAMTYNLSYTGSGNGSGKNTPITATVTATIANADYVDKPAGSYSETVIFTIAP